jgi:hypothetical protein
MTVQPYTNMAGIVLAKFGCEFGYPESTIRYMNAKYPHKRWDWQKCNISRHDTDLIAEIVASPKRFRGVTKDNDGVIFDHELFVKYVPFDIIESNAYRVDRNMCSGEYIVVDMDKFQLYINRKIMESSIKNKLSTLGYVDTMIKSHCCVQSICQAVDMA